MGYFPTSMPRLTGIWASLLGNTDLMLKKKKKKLKFWGHKKFPSAITCSSIYDNIQFNISLQHLNTVIHYWGQIFSILLKLARGNNCIQKAVEEMCRGSSAGTDESTAPMHFYQCGCCQAMIIYWWQSCAVHEKNVHTLTFHTAIWFGKVNI